MSTPFETIQRWQKAVEKVAGVIKERFPHLSVDETLKLAHATARAAIEQWEEKQ